MNCYIIALYTYDVLLYLLMKLHFVFYVHINVYTILIINLLIMRSIV